MSRFSDAGALPQGRRGVVFAPMLLLRRLEPLARPLLHARARWTRAMTLGVRGLARDAAGRVLLIKHTYVAGWHMPGGGVERGETGEQALARELTEELGIAATIGPRITTIRHNYRNGGVIEIGFFAVREYAGEMVNNIFQQMLWTSVSRLPDYDFLAADLTLIRDLADGKLL